MTANGYLAGDPTKVNVGGYLKGDVLAADASGDLQAVPVGPDTDVLTANSAAGEGVDWEAGGGGGGATPSNTVVAETTFAQASTAGVAATYSRGDHTHGTPPAPTAASVGLGNVNNTSDANKPVSTAQAAADATVLSTAEAYTDSQIAAGGFVPSTRTIATTAPLAGGGDLSANRTLTLSDGGVTNTKLADMAASTFKANATGGLAAPQDLTVAQSKTLLAITESDVANLTTDLAGKQPLDADLTTIAGLTATTDNFIQSKASAWSSRTPAQVATDLQALVTVAESQVTGLVADLAAKQPLDSDLTTIAGLTATTDNFMQAKAGAWSSRTVAQVLTDLAIPGTTFQPLDADLTTIAGLTATTNNMIQSVGSAWASRTPTQVKAALAITESDVTNLTTDLAAKAPLAAPALTGAATAVDLTMSGRLIISVDSLTDAATIALNAANGNRFRCLLTSAVGATRQLGTPTNPIDGQMITIEMIQSSTGSNALTYSAGWGFGTDITAATLSTANNKHDFIGAYYNSTAALWYIIAFVKGY